MTCATSESSLLPTMQATREQMQASCCRKNMKACNDGEDECHSLDRPACCNYHQFGRSNQIIRRRIEATHDDAVVALRRLDVELVLQQEPGGSNRVAEAAEHLRRDKGAWSAPCIRREVYPAEKTEQRSSDSICVSGHAGVTSVARHTSGHWLSPHLPLHGMYPAQHTYLENAQEQKQAWREFQYLDTQPRCRLCKLAARWMSKGKILEQEVSVP